MFFFFCVLGTASELKKKIPSGYVGKGLDGAKRKLMNCLFLF
jgi:hypothetical protein